MSWLKGNTTIKGLSSSDQEMLAAIMKLNKIKSASKQPIDTAKKPLQNLFLTLPLLGGLYRSYKEHEINKTLDTIEKLHINQPVKDYHPIYLAAQKLSKVNTQLQELKSYFKPETIDLQQKKIESFRKTLIKQWRNLTTKRFGSTEKHLQVDENNKFDELTTSHILNSLQSTKEQKKWQGARKQIGKQVLKKITDEQEDEFSFLQPIQAGTSNTHKKITWTIQEPKREDNTTEFLPVASLDNLLNILRTGSINPTSAAQKDRSAIPQAELVCGFAVSTDAKWKPAAYKPRAQMTHFLASKNHTHHLRFWAGFGDKFPAKNNENSLTNDIVYLFFKDETIFQQFKAAAINDTQLQNLVTDMEAKNQIKIGVENLLNSAQENSEINSPEQWNPMQNNF